MFNKMVQRFIPRNTPGMYIKIKCFVDACVQHKLCEMIHDISYVWLETKDSTSFLLNADTDCMKHRTLHDDVFTPTA